MIIAQKTYKHKVLLLMKVGLAVFMVVIFLSQNMEVKNFAYKRLNSNEVQYFLNSLNALPETGGSTEILNLDILSQQISEHIRLSVEPILLQEASVFKTVSPSFNTHRSIVNVLMYSFLLSILSILFITAQSIIFKTKQSLKLKEVLSSISPRSPDVN